MKNTKTLGSFIAERRGALGLSLKDLGRLTHKEDGHGVTAQYLHDVERDRRTPSPHVLGELAKALGVDVHYLAAVARHTPPAILEYLAVHPDQAATITDLFERALRSGFTNWESVLKSAALRAA